MNVELPAELDFLKAFYTDPRTEYKKSSWLLSDFDLHIWKYDFNFATPNTINWDITLDDETSLLAPKKQAITRRAKVFFNNIYTFCSRIGDRIRFTSRTDDDV